MMRDGQAVRRRLLSTPNRIAVGLLAVVLVFWLAVMALALGSARLPSQERGLVAAVFPPGWSTDRAFRAVAAADGMLIRRSLMTLIWVARSETPGFVGRLEQAGAWAVFRPLDRIDFLAGGCFYLTPPSRRGKSLDPGLANAFPR